MLVKIITFFLIGMAVLAMFGRLRIGGRARKPKLPPKPAKCPDCGAYVIGKGPCACKSG
jgi:hypothetical protein